MPGRTYHPAEANGPPKVARVVADRRQGMREGEAGRLPLPDRPTVLRYGSAKLIDEHGEIRPFEAVEEEVIRFALDHCCGHVSEVARKLGIGRSTLYRKLRTYGIS